jgi:hypothetical protein
VKYVITMQGLDPRLLKMEILHLLLSLLALTKSRVQLSATGLVVYNTLLNLQRIGSGLVAWWVVKEEGVNSWTRFSVGWPLAFQ